MQRLGEAKLYATSTLHLAAQPFICMNRLPSLDAPKRAHTGKLVTSLLLKGLSELGTGDGITSVVMANTTPEDELLIQRFWPADSVIRMYPSSYSLYVDQIFKGSPHKSLVSFVCDQSPYLDPRWDDIETHVQVKHDDVVSYLMDNYSKQKGVDFNYQPVLLEEVTGNARVLDERDRAQRNFAKVIQPLAKKRGGVSPIKAVGGWACGVLAISDSGPEKAMTRCHLFRHEFDMTHHLEGFLNDILTCIHRHLEDLEVPPSQLAEVVISAASFKSACYLVEALHSKGANAFDLPDFLYGWNPVASLTRLFVNTKRTTLGVFIEKLPFVDIVVIKHGI